MISNTSHVPVVDCHLVHLLVEHAQRLPEVEQSQLFNDLERDPEVGPVVISEVRAHLLHRPS